jgi:hypothetical protein
MNKFYLAHPLKMRFEIRARELEFEKNTGIELINPFYDPKGKSEEVEDTKSLDKAARTAWQEGLPYETIVKNDIDTIERDDVGGTVVYVERTVHTIGTYMEAWHTYSIGKRVFVVTPDWKDHPWLKFVAIKSGGEIFGSFKELEEYMMRKLFVELTTMHRREDYEVQSND